MLKLFRKRALRRQTEIEMTYPLIGNCPVNQRTGDGKSAGRCWHPLYGGYCVTHGNINNLLTETKDGKDYKMIDENELPPYHKRSFSPQFNP
jgi:hypothetical protein